MQCLYSVLAKAGKCTSEHIRLLVANHQIIEYGVNLSSSLEVKSMCNRKGDILTTKCYLNTQTNSELECTLNKFHKIRHVKSKIPVINKLVVQIFGYLKWKDGVRGVGVGDRTYWNGFETAGGQTKFSIGGGAGEIWRWGCI